MSLIITGATVLDGVADKPVEGQSIWIEGGRIQALARKDELGERLRSATFIDARGKYVIPGLMNANVHLLGDPRLENLARYTDHFEDLIVEAAQVALKNGMTTVFDTWGPRRFLMAARDKIAAGRRIGSRIFCGGNIIGCDGPYSDDFLSGTVQVASAAMVRRINAIWVENTGRHLIWQTPEQVAGEVRSYIEKGIDFVKYASNEHFGTSSGAFLAFSPRQQVAIVGEAHQAGLTAQAHTTSIEGLRIAIEAGCDLIQHANVTGPSPIPDATLELMASGRTGAVVFPFTRRRLDWLADNLSERSRAHWYASDDNARRLVESDALLLMANDGSVYPPEIATDAAFSKSWVAPGEDSLIDLGTGHFAWFKAMEEKNCPPIRMLQAATRNVAASYGREKDLGTLEVGKIADLVILDKNPLEAADNYRSIHMVVKDGVVVDREALPDRPMLTKPMDPPTEEEATFVPTFSPRKDMFLRCPMCLGGEGWR
jgi:imidazolonepropionase-like amidohydrolase